MCSIMPSVEHQQFHLKTTIESSMMPKLKGNFKALTKASCNLKKLLKTLSLKIVKVKPIAKYAGRQSSLSQSEAHQSGTEYSRMSEEETQNWLNEQIEQYRGMDWTVQ